MALSTITAIEPIPERSDATPGLWNSRMNAMFQNLQSVYSNVSTSLNTPISTNTLQPESGNTIRVLPVGTGAFIVRSVDSGGAWHDIRAYGAVVDGTTDDIAAVRAAISTASAAGGGIVFFPEGAVSVTSTIRVPNLVHLRGVGNARSSLAATRVNYSGVTGGTIIEIGTGTGSAVNDTAVIDMALDGQSLASYGIHYNVAEYGNHLHRTRIRDCRAAGIYVSSGGGWQGSSMIDVDISSCLTGLDAVDGGNALFSGAFLAGVEISGCTMAARMKGKGIFCHAFIESNWSGGIELQEVHGSAFFLKIENNATRTADTAFNVKVTADSPAYSEGVRLHVDSLGSVDGKGTRYGVWIDRGVAIEVTGVFSQHSSSNGAAVYIGPTASASRNGERCTINPTYTSNFSNCWDDSGMARNQAETLAGAMTLSLPPTSFAGGAGAALSRFTLSSGYRLKMWGFGVSDSNSVASTKYQVRIVNTTDGATDSIDSNTGYRMSATPIRVTSRYTVDKMYSVNIVQDGSVTTTLQGFVMISVEQ